MTDFNRNTVKLSLDHLLNDYGGWNKRQEKDKFHYPYIFFFLGKT